MSAFISLTLSLYAELKLFFFYTKTFSPSLSYYVDFWYSCISAFSSNPASFYPLYIIDYLDFYRESLNLIFDL